MVVEVRYVGNRGHRLWRQINLNEANSLENGFAKEFVLAQKNLLANINAGRGVTFAYFGAGTGTVPLPILLANFSGVNPANAAACGGTGQPTCATLYNSSFFTNATFTTQLHPFAPDLPGFAAGLSSSGSANVNTFRPNRVLAGMASNFFRVNPDVLGGSFLVDKGTQTWYDALPIDVPRTMPHRSL